jgi:hypothetical protein
VKAKAQPRTHQNPHAAHGRADALGGKDGRRGGESPGVSEQTLYRWRNAGDHDPGDVRARHLALLSVGSGGWVGERWAQRHRRIRARGTPGPVAGAAKETVELAAHPFQHGLPDRVVLRRSAPSPGAATVGLASDGEGASVPIFMPGNF